MRRAVSLGIAKTNINTELRAAYFGALDEGAAKRVEALDCKDWGKR